MNEFKLTQQDAPRDQAELFRGIGNGRQEYELLVHLATRGGWSMVSEYLARATGPDYADGACITCWNPRNMPNHGKGTRIHCTFCGTHTVCRAVDIATGDTPGPVSERPRT